MSRIAQLATFIGISVLVLFGIHYFIWARLFRDTALPPFWSRAAALALLGLGGSIPLAFMLGRALGRPLAPLSWLAFGWMGVFFLLLVGLGAAELLRGGIALADLARGAPMDPARRQLLARSLAGAASVFAFGAAARGIYDVLRPVRVNRVEIPLAKLPKALDGFCIAAISDVHLGPTIGPEFLRDIVHRVNALSPDAVAIVGDLVDGTVEELAASAAPLAGLRARHGAFFVTGNHEYYSGAAGWLAHLRTLGIRTLENERVPLGDGLELAGTNDLAGHGFDHGPDLDRALAGRDTAKPLVLLAHQPKTFPLAASRGVDVQISGHTHGGQIWPFGLLVRWQQGFLAGLSRLGESQLYVSRGTGYWGPPMRLGAPAEITQLVLRSVT